MCNEDPRRLFLLNGPVVRLMTKLSTLMAVLSCLFFPAAPRVPCFITVMIGHMRHKRRIGQGSSVKLTSCVEPWTKIRGEGETNLKLM